MYIVQFISIFNLEWQNTVNILFITKLIWTNSRQRNLWLTPMHRTPSRTNKKWRKVRTICHHSFSRPIRRSFPKPSSQVRRKLLGRSWVLRNFSSNRHGQMKLLKLSLTLTISPYQFRCTMGFSPLKFTSST